MQAARKITKIAREAQNLNRLALKDKKIGSSELDLIHYVRHHPGCTQQEVVEGLHAEKGAIAKRVYALQKKGYIDKQRDPQDKRKCLLYPTFQAQALKQSKSDIEDLFYTWLLESLTENEKEHFLETLDLLYRRSKQESRAGFPHVLNRVKGL